MAWVVDTCVLIDVLDDDPHFGRRSAECLQNMLQDGLIVAPISYIELAPAFMGNQQKQEYFLDKMLAVYDEPWIWEDTEVAYPEKISCTIANPPESHCTARKTKGRGRQP
jgi:predicted nucleic acid-binding protein